MICEVISQKGNHIAQHLNMPYQAQVRVQNRGAVLRAMLACHQLSRQDLVRLSGLTPAAVTNIVRELLDSGLLVEVGNKSSSGSAKVGRRQILLELNPSAAYVLAVHLGVRYVLIGLADLRANLFARRSIRIAEYTSPENVLQDACTIAQRLMAESAPPGARCLGIGVGAIGLVDPRVGVSRASTELGWESIPVGEMFRGWCGLPTFVENNVRAMALGETWFGCGRDVKNLILVYVASVVGCGIIIDRQLYRGSRFGAGQMGHVVVEQDGPPCTCGGYGCLEAIASQPAIAAAGKEAAARRRDTLLRSLVNGDLDSITASTVFQAAALGDLAAQHVVDRVAEHLSLAIWNLARVLDPDRIVLAGLDSQGRALLVERVQRIVSSRFISTPGEQLKIVPTAIGDDLALVGAATLALVPFYHAPILVGEDG